MTAGCVGMGLIESVFATLEPHPFDDFTLTVPAAVKLEEVPMVILVPEFVKIVQPVGTVQT